MYSREDKIYVKINKVGFIPYIGICGPIPNPIKIPTATCLQMINAGIDVFEVNPDTKETVKLTVQNVFDDNKFGKKIAPAVEPTKHQNTTPVDNIKLSGVKIPEASNEKVEDALQEKSDDTDIKQVVDVDDKKDAQIKQNAEYKNKNKNKYKK